MTDTRLTEIEYFFKSLFQEKSELYRVADELILELLNSRQKVAELNKELQELKECQNCLHNDMANVDMCRKCTFFDKWAYYN